MKLTRKQLNHILLQLPHPSLVLEGRIAPFIRVPIYEELALIHDSEYPDPQTHLVRNLTFEYSPKDMDWVLKDLVLQPPLIEQTQMNEYYKHGWNDFVIGLHENPYDKFFEIGKWIQWKMGYDYAKSIKANEKL